MFRAICKILFLFGLAVFLPRFLLLYAPNQHVFWAGLHSFKNDVVKLGAENFSNYLKLHADQVNNNKILLVTNQIRDAAFNTYLQFLSDNSIVPDLIYPIKNSYVFTKLSYNYDNNKAVKLPNEIVSKISNKEVNTVDVITVDLQASGLGSDAAVKELMEVMQLSLKYAQRYRML